MASFLSIKERFRKRVVFYLQCGYLFILVGSYSDELRVWERDVGHHSVVSSHANDVNLWLILVKRIQHNLATSTEFVGEFDFAE